MKGTKTMTNETLLYNAVIKAIKKEVKLQTELELEKMLADGDVTYNTVGDGRREYSTKTMQEAATRAVDTVMFNGIGQLDATEIDTVIGIIIRENF